MKAHEKLNYAEFAAHDLEATKAFFRSAFDWHFTDYGPDYMAFGDEGVEGGFYRAPLCSRSEQGAALLIFYSRDIKATLHKVEQSGGTINKPLFDFPGGCRFHFLEPSGNEFAVWSESIRPKE